MKIIRLLSRLKWRWMCAITRIMSKNKDRVEGGIIFCLGVPGENFIDKEMLKVGT